MRRIELKDGNCKVILRAFENVLSIKEFIILEKRPKDISPEDCRQLKDGRWFIVTEVAINYWDGFLRRQRKLNPSAIKKNQLPKDLSIKYLKRYE